MESTDRVSLTDEIGLIRILESRRAAFASLVYPHSPSDSCTQLAIDGSTRGSLRNECPTFVCGILPPFHLSLSSNAGLGRGYIVPRPQVLSHDS